MQMKFMAVVALGALVAACGGGADKSGGQAAGGRAIRVVGSSTVYPFTTAVAEQFVRKNPNFAPPIVESTGTGAGMKLFCAGIGSQHPDIEDASRRMKASEAELCQKNGVKTIVEIKVGVDGLAFAAAKKSPLTGLTTEDLYKALAANPYGKPQTAKTWKDVNPALPAIAISVYGPPPTSGTRDSLNELVLEAGCKKNPEMKALKETDEDKYKELCTKIREDGMFVEAGENDNLIVQKIEANPNSVGAFGYSFLEENTDKVKGLAIDGVVPTGQTITDLSYPASRPLFIYVKGEHLNVVPGLKEFVAEYTRESTFGPDGYLARRGLIASPTAEREQMRAIAEGMTPLDVSALK